MSRPASGDDAVLMNAREAIASARTVEQLRQAQAVVLPLEYAMSLADTAQVIGVSPGWACQLRKRFMRGQVVGAPDAPTPGGVPSIWGAKWHWLQPTTCCTATTGDKLAPDKRHPQSDPVAQTEWKKTPRGPYPNPQRLGARPTHQTDVSRRGAFWAHLARVPVLGTQTNACALPRHADACFWCGGCLHRRAR
jgi:hypothetical protein